MKDGLTQIIINVEAQKDEPKEYEIPNRAILYVSWLISSQKERNFENSSYDDIKRVYSDMGMYEYGRKQHEPYPPYEWQCVWFL